MKINHLFAAAVICLGASFAVATAGVKCDEKASKKGASCCSSMTKKASTKSNDHCTAANASTTAAHPECTQAEKEACQAKMAKKAKNSSCCTTKGTKVSQAATTTTDAQASATATTSVK